MFSQLNDQDREQIDAGIREKYHKVAVMPDGHFKYPTGADGLKQLGYDNRLIADLPDTVADSFCGVGNPFSLGKIDSGVYVLDIGCGSGVDARAIIKMGTGFTEMAKSGSVNPALCVLLGRRYLLQRAHG